MSGKHQPLAGITVVDLSQFLAGPYAALRLQDLGARIIKIERLEGGDLTRSLYLSDTMVDGESTIFHAINRGKESLALNLKAPEDLAVLKRLLVKADVLIQNFRPGVIERLGLGYEAVRSIAPHIVYGSISGYGPDGPWARFPGQDLLAQARSGVMWLNGHEGDGPVPFGLAVADMFAGANLCQGILAALVGQGRTGVGSHVETSLIEAMVDFQFEVLATHLNDGGRAPQRSGFRSAHVGLSAPYGVYPTADGYLALAMTPLDRLAELLPIPELSGYAARPESWFAERDDIKRLIADCLAGRVTQDWLDLLQPHDIWCCKVLDWTEFLRDEAFTRLDMVHNVTNGHGTELRLMSSPVRINGVRSKSSSGAPDIGEHSARIRAEFGLDQIDADL